MSSVTPATDGTVEERHNILVMAFESLMKWLGFIPSGEHETSDQERVRSILNDASLSLEEKKARAAELAEELSMPLLHEIFQQDLDKKLAFLGSEENQKEFLKDAEAAADIWWKSAENQADEVINTTDDNVALRQHAINEKAEYSAELFQQLYYDAAKAQKRLVQVGDVVEQEKKANGLPGDISDIRVSMPTIKGTVRATYKTWMPDNQRLLSLKSRRDAGETLPKAEEEEILVLEKTIYGDGEDQPFAAGLRDMARGTIEVPKLSEVPKAVLYFFNKTKEKCPGAELTRFKNKFKAMYEGKNTSGYADVQVHIRVDGGHICEMQFNCKSMMDFKSFGTKHRNTDSEGDNPASNWALLLNGEDKLLDTLASLKQFDIATMVSTDVPDGAITAIEKFKAAEATHKWPLNAHVIYDITRWLEGAGLTSSDHDPLRNTIVTKLKALSKAGSEAFQATIATTEAGEGQNFRDVLRPVAAFELSLGNDPQPVSVTLKEPNP